MSTKRAFRSVRANAEAKPIAVAVLATPPLCCAMVMILAGMLDGNRFEQLKAVYNIKVTNPSGGVKGCDFRGKATRVNLSESQVPPRAIGE